MKTKACDLCRCTVTPTYAMKHLDEFANLVCKHDTILQNLNVDGSLDILKGQNNVSTSTVTSGVTTTIVGDLLGGSIELITGSTRLSGNVIEWVYPTPFSTAPYVLISDVYDNYAMGHTGVFKVSSTATKLTIAVKTGLSLELNQGYKLNFLIKQ